LEIRDKSVAEAGRLIRQIRSSRFDFRFGFRQDADIHVGEPD
jgi:hypothetical protein